MTARDMIRQSANDIDGNHTLDSVVKRIRLDTVSWKPQISGNVSGCTKYY